MKYRCFLDGVLLLSEPIGLDKLVTSIKYDKALKTMLISQDASLTFIGDGYTILYEDFTENSFCSQKDFEIQVLNDLGDWKIFYQGIVFSKYIEWDEKRGFAKTKIEDNSFYAKINNNRSVESLIYSGKTKNGKVITPCPLGAIKLFRTTDGGYFTETAKAYKIFDVLSYMVSFMTDDTVTFGSETFDVGGKWEGIFFTSGLAISNFKTLTLDEFKEAFPRLKWDELLKELDHLLNIGAYVDYSGAKPKLFLETLDKLKVKTKVFEAANVDELKTRTDNDYLYSTVHLGCENTDETPTLSFRETVNFLGFKDEKFNFLGNCNIDSELDLTKKYVISSNIIQDAIETGNPTYDDAFFLIHCEYVSAAWQAIKTNVLFPPPPPYFYNQEFTNNKCLERHLGQATSIAEWLGNGIDHRFQATKTTGEGTSTPATIGHLVAGTGNRIEPIPFENDFTSPNFDDANKFSLTNFDYTVTDKGYYSFEIDLNLLYIYFGSFDNLPMDFYIVLREYDSGGFAGGVQLNSYIVSQSTESPVGGDRFTFNMFDRITVYCNATIGSPSRFVLSLEVTGDFTFISSTSTWVTQGSRFACTKDANNGGIYLTYDPGSRAVLQHEFTFPFNLTDFFGIIANIRGYIEFYRQNGIVRNGYINQIKFDHHSGQATFALNSSSKSNTL